MAGLLSTADNGTEQVEVKRCAKLIRAVSTAKPLTVVVVETSLTASNANVYELVVKEETLLARVLSTAKHQAVRAVPASLTAQIPGLRELRPSSSRGESGEPLLEALFDEVPLPDDGDLVRGADALSKIVVTGSSPWA